MADRVAGIARAGIPVIGHLGLTPQSVSAQGGFRLQGKGAAQAKKIVDDARALEEAGARMVACADIEEALVLREAGVRCRILVFGALSVSDVDGVFAHALTPTISSPAAGQALSVAV